MGKYTTFTIYLLKKQGVVSWEKIQVCFLAESIAIPLVIHIIDGAHATALKFASDPSEWRQLRKQS